MNNFGLPENFLSSIISVFKSYKIIDSVILYGSRAKGNNKNGSDIDITIKGQNLNIKDLYAIEEMLDELLLPYKIDLSIYDNIDNKNLLDHIDRVGISIF